MERLSKIYKESVVPELMKRFGYKNVMQAPRMVKIVVNVGLGEMAHNKDIIEKVRDEVAVIAGQRPVLTKAKKAISNFKIKLGSPVGYKVTLRGVRMYEFFDKLVNFCMPRIRDFRGVPRSSFDGSGNYTIGIKEQNIFPELDLDKIPMAHGLDISIATSAPTDKEAMELLELLGMPFSKEKRS